MATKNTSKTAQSARYKTNKTWETNRIARLERTIKNQPNNEQAKAALKGMVYRRKTPTNPTWSSTWIKVAKLFKEFGGRFDPAIMGSNVEAARAALQRQSPYAALPFTKPTASVEKSFFSILARANMAKVN